jgi:8-oxo-dGTP pyrophosphatase MutT (NUDIX family)
VSEASAAQPVEPRPAASVVLLRASAAGAPEPLEIYMIRRKKQMRFLGGFYAFPGGKVDAADAAPALLTRCHGLDPDHAESIFPGTHGHPALAFWVTAVRELIEETGVFLVCGDDGQTLDVRSTAATDPFRKKLMAGEPFADLLLASGWRCDLRPLGYFSHFVTPRTSPIRFSARFFLCAVPDGQEPRLFTEETSEGFWIHPGEAYRRFRAREMAMAEPAEYGCAYLAQFDSLAEVLVAHAGGGAEKLRGIIDRIDFKLWKDFDWAEARWTTPSPSAG